MIVRFWYGALALTISKGVFAAQPSAASPVSAPLRGLPWGQLNFLHTTDTHGWHAGHLQECEQISSVACEASTDLEVDHRSAPTGVITSRLQNDYTRERMKKV